VHRYFPHTPDDIKAMLGQCGLNELKELYSDVPGELMLKEPYDLPKQMSEPQVRRFFNELGSRNRPGLVCFAGAGFYEHYSPAAALNLVQRSEFLTAYTPYQPEISQGTLQYIFEYQSMMARLTGMEISNASMYDGATATAEAMLMAVAAGRKKRRVLVSETINPAYRRVVDTYAHYHGIEVTPVAAVDGVTSRQDLEEKLAAHADVAAVIVPVPNYFGIIEDHSGLAGLVHSRKALLVMTCVASDLASLRTPGEWGADIACGDAQSLGIPLSFGGPYLGFLCATKALMRKMPGRVVGATTDSEGRRCFVLTLQAREQHIRREKATSNICSNQGLMTLYVSIYLSLMGAAGLQEINERSHAGAVYLLEQLTADGRARLRYPGKPFLNEFLLETDYKVDTLIHSCVKKAGILPGVKVSDHEILIAVTEMQTREDMDRLAAVARECM